MTDVTRILNAIEQGDPKAADELLPLVYEELRLLAARKMAHESPGHTLQATVLVHEAYIRPVRSDARDWSSQTHFFAAAAEVMRHILIDNTRRKQRERHGGGQQKISLDRALVHLANISYRLSRSLDFDPVKQQFINDNEANGMLTRQYRKPFVVPKNV